MPMHRRRFLETAFFTAALGVPLRSRADDLTPGIHPLGLDHSRDGILYLPRAYRAGAPLPLVVMFHGAGSSGRNCEYAFSDADRHGFIVVAPDSRDEKTWDIILGEFGPDGEFLQRALQQTMARCSVDTKRLAMVGHSDGASYALSFGISVGDEFSHIAAMSPGVMTPFAARGKPRLFLSHGRSDTVMPIDDTSRKFVPRLRGLGYDVTYQEYDGRHAVPAEIVASAFAWMAAGFAR